MVAVVDDKLVFSRDQVLTSSQASKNFGEAKKRARRAPLYVADRNDGIDTVIVSFDEFESMAVELQRLRNERVHALASARIARDSADGGAGRVPVEAVIGKDEFARLLDAESVDKTPDSELFE